MGITDFAVFFIHNGKSYAFDASKITRSLTDGAGQPILSARVYGEDGSSGICNLTPDWRIVSLYMD